MLAALLTTKLYFPPVRPSLVARPRLVERLGAGLLGPLTLLSAPAGYGKTTLFSEWRSGPGARRLIAWLSLGAEDNDPGRFFQYFSAALDNLQPGLAEAIQPHFQGVETPPPAVLLTSVINQLSSLEDHAILVLDDYHLIDNPEIHQALIFLLEHLPPRLHLALLTRADPPFPLARLRARGQLTEIRAEHMRFSLAECADFLKRVMDLDLTAEQVLALERRTEGWVAGLQLAALSMQGRDDLPGFISAFTGSHHYILDYLMEEVLSRQPAELRDFLMHTSILERLSGPLCDALAGRTDSDLILERLKHTNLFVIPLDDQDRWYRYHHLFADLLRNRLQTEQRQELPSLHRQAALWFEHHALWFEALEHLLAAGEYEYACRLISDNMLAIIRQHKLPPVLHWMQSLPDAVVRQNPRVCLLCGYLQESLGNIDAYDSYIQSAEKALSLSTERFPPGSPEHADVLAEIRVNQADLAIRNGNPEAALPLTEEALAIARADAHFIRSQAYMHSAWANRELGEIEAAIPLCQQGLIEARLGAHPGMTSGSVMVLGGLTRLLGHWHSAAQLLHEGLHYAQKMGHAAIPVYASVHYELTRVYYEQNELDQAEAHLETGLQLSQQGMRSMEILEGHALQVLLRMARGDVANAAQTLEEAIIEEQTSGIRQFHADLSYYQARLQLGAGHPAEAEAWLNGPVPAIQGKLGYLQGIHALQAAHLLLGLNRLDEALDLLTRILDAAQNSGCTGWQIEALALLAVAWQKKKNPSQASHFLQEALTLAEPESPMRLILDAGSPMLDLLHTAQKRGLSPGFVSRLVAAFSRIGSAKAPQSTAAQGPLSKREVELLRLVADGCSNKEIASQLVISIGTVKRHTVNIFTKLDVKNRTEAVARARHLGLL